MMNFNFQNKMVLITGASRGVGAAAAQLFANAGARVALHYNQNKEKAEAVIGSLSGENHQLFQADLVRKEAGVELVEQVINAFGNIDIIINNAGIYEEHPQEETDLESWMDVWERTINICLLAPAHISYAATPYMIKNGGGKIINITSRGAFRGEPTATAYGAAKAGLNSVSQSMAKALGNKNVFVYAVAPGFIETEMVQYLLDGEDADFYKNQSPLSRFSKPEEIAKTIAFLASEGTDYLTGGIIDVNGASYLRS
ncbi:SDR family oxidoreductase [Lentimicrobium sp. S6]|nr:SDR family oxidoreductase [Lentimicrobium sp. S6]